MRIGALARQTGVSARLLRYYEEQGLLRPTRLANGYREYTDADAVAVTHVRALLAAGLPTTVIAQVLHCVHHDGHRLVPSACPGMADHLERERARIAATVAELDAAQRALDSLIAALPAPAAGPPAGGGTGPAGSGTGPAGSGTGPAGSGTGPTRRTAAGVRHRPAPRPRGR